MHLTDMAIGFKLNLRHVAPFNYVTLNGETKIFTDDQLEDFECGLTDLLHAICMYKRSKVNEP